MVEAKCQQVAALLHTVLPIRGPAETAVIMVEAKCQQVAELLHTVLTMC
jgi:hypothetical protein